MTVKLTPAQARLLGRIVATNGGGLRAADESVRTWGKLHQLDLIQGKSGNGVRMVHTALGLQTWRAISKDPHA